MTKINILSGLNIPSQIPLDPKTRCINELTLKGLGLNDNLAYTYYKGLEVTCIEENTKWEWKEVEIGDEKLLDIDFTYPNGLIVDGVDYSNKVYNFAKIVNEILPQNLQNVIDVGAEAEVDGGNSSISLLAGSEENRYCHADVSNPTESAGWSIIPTRARIQSFVNSVSIGRLDMENGEVKLKRIKNSVFPNLETKLTIMLPTVTTEIRVTAKTISGIYNIVVEPNSPYLVSTLPIGQLGDIAVVTDATTPTYLGVLTGGGTTITPVWHNGTIWVAR